MEQPQEQSAPASEARQDLRNLRRSSADRVIAGVCGGLGRYTGIDPVIFRITLAVLAVFGGAGLLLYAIAWLVIPDDTASQSEAQRLLRGRGTVFTLCAFAIGVLGVIAIANVVGHGWPGPFPAIILAAALGALIVYRHGAGRDDEAAAREPDPYADRYAGPYADPVSEPWTTPASAPSGPSAAGVSPGPIASRSRHEPSLMGPVGLSVGLVVAGALLALGASNTLDVTAQAVFAAALLAIGLALVAGAWLGRSPALVVVGAILTVALALSATLHVPLRGGIGDRYDAPATLSEVQPSYRLALGQQRLDLSQLPLDGATQHIDASVGVGALTVIVPPNTNVIVHAHTGAGQLRLFGHETDGTQVTRHVTMPAAGGQAGELSLDLRVGLGQVEVWRSGAPHAGLPQPPQAPDAAALGSSVRETGPSLPQPEGAQR